MHGLNIVWTGERAVCVNYISEKTRDEFMQTKAVHACSHSLCADNMAPANTRRIFMGPMSVTSEKGLWNAPIKWALAKAANLQEETGDFLGFQLISR